MKNFSHLIAKILILTIITASLGACNGSEDTTQPPATKTPESTNIITATPAPEATKAPTATTSPETTIAPTAPPADTAPEVRNLNGMELVIGIPYYSAVPATPEFLALQEYREEMMKKHNFTVRVENIMAYGEPLHIFQTAAALGDSSVHIYQINARSLAGNTHLFYDLSTLPEINFSEKKWNDAITKSMSYQGGIYGMAPLTLETPAIGGILYNKRLFKEAGLDPDLPYQLQKSGDWTWDTFKELCTKLTRDTDKDGTTDVYATCSYGGEMLEQLLSSTGSQIVTNNNGIFVNNAVSDPVLRACTFATELASSRYEMSCPPDGSWNYYETAFVSGKSAMQFIKIKPSLFSTGTYALMEDELGFVCCPKMDSSVDYHMDTDANVSVIPAFYDEKTASDIAFAFNLWTGPDSSDGSHDYDWRTLYRDMSLDEKTLTETLPYYYERNLGEIPARLLINKETETAFYYQFPFTQAPISRYLNNLSASLETAVADTNNAKAPNVTANPNFENFDFSVKVNLDGTVAITRHKKIVSGALVLPDEINGMVVSEITGDAFSNCGLTSVVLPRGLKKIGAWAFAFGDFTEFVLPEGLTTICRYAVTGSYLQTVTVPASVTTIEKNAFSSNVDLTLIVEKGSYAETYAKENGLKVQYK